MTMWQLVQKSSSCDSNSEKGTDTYWSEHISRPWWGRLMLVFCIYLVSLVHVIQEEPRRNASKHSSLIYTDMHCRDSIDAQCMLFRFGSYTERLSRCKARQHALWPKLCPQIFQYPPSSLLMFGHWTVISQSHSSETVGTILNEGVYE